MEQEANLVPQASHQLPNKLSTPGEDTLHSRGTEAQPHLLVCMTVGPTWVLLKPKKQSKPPSPIWPFDICTLQMMDTQYCQRSYKAFRFQLFKNMR